MRRLLAACAASTLATAVAALPVAACGGLIGPNGAVNLLRTTTFVGYHDGVEHYVTAFAFNGGGGAFGSITPLPGIPTSVEKGGDWTLQRLIQETEPPRPDVLFEAQSAPTAGRAEVLLETKVDALDITVLKGGGDEVGAWAEEHGFRLPPDAPEMLDFYAQRSPIFLAAAFDADAAAERGQAIGDGTPVHITIPTDDPWVPLRILALGKTADAPVDADVFLLTDQAPTLLPAATGDDGLVLDHTAPASESLLSDLRSDRGMEWLPNAAWLMKVQVAARAADLRYDLAVDASGRGLASRVSAGLEAPTQSTPDAPEPPAEGSMWVGGLGMLLASGLGLSVWTRRRRASDGAADTGRATPSAGA